MSMLNDWISKHVRMPEKEDLDKRGRVIVWNEFSGADMMGMHELKNWAPMYPTGCAFRNARAWRTDGRRRA